MGTRCRGRRDPEAACPRQDRGPAVAVPVGWSEGEDTQLRVGPPRHRPPRRPRRPSWRARRRPPRRPVHSGGGIHRPSPVPCGTPSVGACGRTTPRRTPAAARRADTPCSCTSPRADSRTSDSRAVPRGARGPHRRGGSPPWNADRGSPRNPWIPWVRCIRPVCAWNSGNASGEGPAFSRDSGWRPRRASSRIHRPVSRLQFDWAPSSRPESRGQSQSFPLKQIIPGDRPCLPEPNDTRGFS
jgi:hypothetical protein